MTTFIATMLGVFAGLLLYTVLVFALTLKTDVMKWYTKKYMNMVNDLADEIYDI